MPITLRRLPFMQQKSQQTERRTSIDVVFEQLREEIVSLRLLPGTRISEAEVAKRFGVSRQPVRDAFNRLHNLDLLLIRPQKATVVRGFSREQIEHTRFVRLSVELEVIRRACEVWSKTASEKIRPNLRRQKESVEAGNSDAFHHLDFEFHALICELSGCPLAIETLIEARQKTDRLCVLSFGREREAVTLLSDHEQLISAIEQRSVDTAADIVRTHLSRLDETIISIHESHAEYFE